MPDENIYMIRGEEAEQLHGYVQTMRLPAVQFEALLEQTKGWTVDDGRLVRKPIVISRDPDNAAIKPGKYFIGMDIGEGGKMTAAVVEIRDGKLYLKEVIHDADYRMANPPTVSRDAGYSIEGRRMGAEQRVEGRRAPRS